MEEDCKTNFNKLSMNQYVTDEMKLLETMLYVSNQGISLLQDHLKRLHRSQTFFQQYYTRFNKFPSTSHILNQITVAIQKYIQENLGMITIGSVEEPKRFLTQPLPDNSTPFQLRVRLTINNLGECDIEITEEPILTGTPNLHACGKLCSIETAPVRRVRIDTTPVDSSDIFLHHKTTHRDIYNQARSRNKVGQLNAGNPPLFDVILFNERNEITETTIANLAIKPNHSQHWLTPPLSSGCLPGVQRQQLLAAGKLQEQILTKSQFIQDIKEGGQVFCFNAIRGVYQVNVILKE